ncbi:MAG: RimK family alpha-L-glutamate ligase [Draconibacterium sp.]|nr:RimK family alpha-L-glutamate ligase [Draconibacterium sp.]
MKIVVLSRNANLYSTRRIVEAGNDRKHEMLVVDHTKCDLIIEKKNPVIIYKGVKLKDKTVFTNYSKNVKEIIQGAGGTPVVIKLLEGTQGLGVVLAETDNAAESVIDAFNGLKIRVIVQEFIKEAQGSDIRAFVVDGVVVGAMKRTAKGEFRSNLHRGGTAELIQLSDEEENAALKAAKAMGLGICGVDLLQSNHGALILEVNSSPGLEGIESATGKNIAKSIIRYVERHA